MGNTKTLIGFLIILGCFSCKSTNSKATNETKQFNRSDFVRSDLFEEVTGEVRSINLNRDVYEILIEDTNEKLYKILSVENNTSSQDNVVVVGGVYDLRLLA